MVEFLTNKKTRKGFVERINNGSSGDVIDAACLLDYECIKIPSNEDPDSNQELIDTKIDIHDAISGSPHCRILVRCFRRHVEWS